MLVAFIKSPNVYAYRARVMEYLELLGEVVGHDGREGRKERSHKDADVADVDGDVEEVEGMVQGCRGDHQT